MVINPFDNTVLAVVSVKLNLANQGRIAEENGFGLWCKNGDLKKFMANMSQLADHPEAITAMGTNGHRFILANYTVDQAANILETMHN